MYFIEEYLYGFRPERANGQKRVMGSSMLAGKDKGLFDFTHNYYLLCLLYICPSLY